MARGIKARIIAVEAAASRIEDKAPIWEPLTDGERAARTQELFTTGRLALEADGSIHAPDPAMAELAGILEMARQRQREYLPSWRSR